MTNSMFQRAVIATLLTTALGVASATDVPVNLTGAQEVPANTSTAKGTGKITVTADKSVSGMIKTAGMTGTMAHIHEAPAGKNGPPIITLEKSADGSSWSVPAGAKLTDEQYASGKTRSAALFFNFAIAFGLDEMPAAAVVAAVCQADELNTEWSGRRARNATISLRYGKAIPHVSLLPFIATASGRLRKPEMRNLVCTVISLFSV
jgi:hypothetical protein